MTPELLLEYWDRAASVECGIAISTNDPKALRTRLLNAAREAGHPATESIITFLPEGRNEVFMCRRTVELPV